MNEDVSLSFDTKEKVLMNTVWAVVRDGKIFPLEEIEASEGTKVLVTLLSEEESFWVAASETSLGAV
jgi:hypothetical protein